MRLTICVEDLLLLHPLIARFSTETAAFFSFRLLHRQCVHFWMHSDVHFLSASPSFVVARRSLSFAHFCFSRRRLPFSHLILLLVAFLVVVPSSASHSFTSASRRHRWPATGQFQLLISSHSQCRLVVVLRVPQETSEVRNNLLAVHCTKVTRPSEKLPLKIQT